jgi:hypothetical protein
MAAGPPRRRIDGWRIVRLAVHTAPRRLLRLRRPVRYLWINTATLSTKTVDTIVAQYQTTICQCPRPAND